MWEDNLKKIIDEKKIYDEEVNLGASKDEINELIVEAKKKIGIEIPNEYLDIISKVNGIEFNGFILYGVDKYLLEHEINQSIYGLIASNEIWYENEEQKKYLFLGESNISWYVYEYKNKSFIELDNPSGRESNKFNSFYELFNKLLADAVM
ncbi:SMI1/KNR4 family protein [Clostridium botulinum]|uniref:YrhA family protein n=1 Tax=Clostridium sp. ZBS12 TaxID=2949972 RepID=UPI00050169D5|nr:YrhA family protein [Clostridium sp. ZBS12]KFX57255.1 SMI1 / KNR4 family protein [Clostridium botulinum]MBY6802544.1 SMI1/KNR4 family protein [Clostridium botulinum]MBY6819211.1 SMI1/KNR4 family protein [Clostridium botulinum]NFJ50626.1 SMI1/KNR4 family protein [Clostridium botulinum]NFP09133.1 SMI1/KNR4 family protein [Clostridium botulinum]